MGVGDGDVWVGWGVGGVCVGVDAVLWVGGVGSFFFEQKTAYEV